MKPSYIFALLLPVATQLATAGPTAGGGHDHDGDHDSNRKDTHDTHDTHNPCEVKVSYPYYKYPCHSAPSNGTSQLGATFTSYCKYQYVPPVSATPLANTRLT